MREALDHFRIGGTLDGNGDLLSPKRVVTAEDAGAAWRQDAREQLFDFERVHIFSSADDPIREAAEHVQTATRIDVSEVAGGKPGRRGVALGLTPVAAEQH